jgi:hypothetical protein
MSTSIHIAPWTWLKGPSGRIVNTQMARENNALTKALQIKEQRDRVRGVSSKLTWKEGFLKHKFMYWKQKMTSTTDVDVKLKR